MKDEEIELTLEELAKIIISITPEEKEKMLKQVISLCKCYGKTSKLEFKNSQSGIEIVTFKE